MVFFLASIFNYMFPVTFLMCNYTWCFYAWFFKNFRRNGTKFKNYLQPEKVNQKTSKTATEKYYQSN